MNQPTDRMLIDALCIVAAFEERRQVEGRSREYFDILKRAREIIRNYAPMAIARIVREQADLAEHFTESFARAPIDARTTPEERAGGGERGYRLLTPAQAAEAVEGTQSISLNRVQISMEKRPDGSYWGTVTAELREIEGDPHHGLSPAEVEFLQMLEDAHREGGSLTIELEGRQYTGVRIIQVHKFMR